MSHQTGITGNDELLSVFGKSKCGKIRLFKISIFNEQLILDAACEPQEHWKADFQLIRSQVQEDVPCYILYRLDEKSSLGYLWLLISWTPDTANVRDKMLYASTKSTLKSSFGSQYIKEELHATSVDEITLEGYLRYKSDDATPAPLSYHEEELLQIKKTELVTNVSTETRQLAIGNIACPISDSAIGALKKLKSHRYNYLQFHIELKGEKIDLTKALNIKLHELPKEIPTENARYHIYLFEHTHEVDFLQSFVFIYSMPGYNCSVKERMMYSSYKSVFLDTIESTGIHITKKLEIDDGGVLTEEFLKDEIHPKKLLHQPKFAKPKGPEKRGPKRVITTKFVE